MLYSTLLEVFPNIDLKQSYDTLLDYYTTAMNIKHRQEYNQKSLFGPPLNALTGEAIEYEDIWYNCIINPHLQSN